MLSKNNKFLASWPSVFFPMRSIKIAFVSQIARFVIAVDPELKAQAWLFPLGRRKLKRTQRAPLFLAAFSFDKGDS